MPPCSAAGSGWRRGRIQKACCRPASSFVWPTWHYDAYYWVLVEGFVALISLPVAQFKLVGV